MTHLYRPLAQLLLGDTATAQAAAASLSKAGQWSDALKLSFEWRVTPQFWQRIQELSLELPEATRKEISGLCRIISIKSNTAAHRSAQVLTRLAADDIPAIAFKGIGVMASLYAKPSDRMVGDLDLLIAPEALQATCDTLQSLGFCPVVSGDLTNYLDYLDHRTRQDNLFLIFKDRSGFEIDLHWGLKAIAGSQFSVPSLIEQAVQGHLLGQAVTVANPVDAVLLATHHSVRDDFAPASSVKDLCDLQAWWSKSEDWSVTDLAKRAQQVGLSVPLLALWTILAEQNPTGPAVKGVQALQQTLSPADQTQALHLALLFRCQLDGETINRDVLHSLSLTTLIRFVKRRWQKPQTLSFDQSLWGVQSETYTSAFKRQRLFRTLRHLNSRKLSAYRTLAALQNND